MNLKRFLCKLKKAWHILTLKAKASYSQAGEDIIIQYLFDSLKIHKPTYLEIGTNYPVLCNNTYHFYLTGSYGVCVEPDSSMIGSIRTKRPNDVILNIGIGLSDIPDANFYLFPTKVNGWSTFSKSEAMLREKETGIGFSTLQVPLKPINDVISQYFKPYPNFISLDIEGLDLEVLQSLDFERYKPEVICVETITFGYLSNTEEKIDSISKFMHSKGYFTYADTHINTIYCRVDAFKYFVK
jgi:FkbM family methyltransferase